MAVPEMEPINVCGGSYMGVHLPSYSGALHF